MFALTNQVQETAHFLDLETGDVIPVFEFNRDEVLAMVRTHPERYIRLVAQTRRQGLEMMRRFIQTVSRQDLRARLVAAIQNGRVFSQFRQELMAFPDEYRRWQQFRLMVLTEPLKERLRALGIELVLVRDTAPSPPEVEPD